MVAYEAAIFSYIMGYTDQSPFRIHFFNLIENGFRLVKRSNVNS